MEEGMWEIVRQSLDSLAARMELKKPPGSFERKDTMLCPTHLDLIHLFPGQVEEGPEEEARRRAGCGLA